MARSCWAGRADKVAHVAQHDAEIAAPCADVGVVRPEGGLADRQGVFVLGTCAGGQRVLQIKC
jgi:hypothetical protein